MSERPPSGDPESGARDPALLARAPIILRGSAHTGDLRLRDVERLADGAIGDDRNGYRRELVELVGRARELMGEYVEFAERRY